MRSVITILSLCFLCNASWGQSITKSIANYCIFGDCNNRCVYTSRYLISNDNHNQIILFFTEEEISKNDTIQQLRRKVLRPYGDFHLALLEWDDIIIDDTCSLVPELFVKVLNPNETFEIIVISDSEEPNVDLCKHILVCNETNLSQIGLSRFVHYLDDYNFYYKYSYIVISESVLRTFISKNNARLFHLKEKAPTPK